MNLDKAKWMLLDACLTIVSFGIAYVLLSLSFRSIGRSALDVAEQVVIYWSQMLLLVGGFVVVRLTFFSLFSLYRGITRFAGVHELRQVILAVSGGSAVLVLWDFAFAFSSSNVLVGSVLATVPVPVIVTDWLACIVLVGGSRMAWRLWNLARISRGVALRNVIIVGAGDLGEGVARNFIRNPQIGYQPLGFVDEHEALWGKHIHGLPVMGGVVDLPDLIHKHDISDVLVALPKPSIRFMNQVVEICENDHVGFKIIPSVSDVMEQKVSISQMRPVEIEDLLGRAPVEMVLDAAHNYLKGERVLITGGGGSIGSELCRQALQCEPEKVLLLGRGENSIYELASEIQLAGMAEKIELIIADIQDVDRMAWVFEHYRPSVVFHAAAHKHVPLMELHPSEAIKNNVFGTFNLAFLCREHAIKRLILISSDKAVRPTNVMGASKRVAEMILAAFSQEPGSTTFLSVRFGNVLGSRGSVVPLFRKQIAAGGPVTVTHPEVTRYFMTIPEAVNLVLQAGSLGANGELFLLDMGEPVKIADLARRMITLSGYEPDADIEIRYTGLRPGEKLKEELLTDNENLSPTEHEKIMATRVEKPALEKVKNWLKAFNQCIDSGDMDQVLQELRRIVPEFHAEVESDQPEQDV